MLIKINNFYLNNDLSFTDFSDELIPDNFLAYQMFLGDNPIENRKYFKILTNNNKYISYNKNNTEESNLYITKNRDKATEFYFDNNFLYVSKNYYNYNLEIRDNLFRIVLINNKENIFLVVLDDFYIDSVDLSNCTIHKKFNIEFNILDRETIGEGTFGCIYSNPRLLCSKENFLLPNEISKILKIGGNSSLFKVYNIPELFFYEENYSDSTSYMFLPKKMCDIDLPKNVNYGKYISTKHIIYDLGLNEKYIIKINNQLRTISGYYNIFLPFRNIIKAIYFINNKGFIHGDIKYNNISVDQITGDYKLIDLSFYDINIGIDEGDYKYFSFTLITMLIKYGANIVNNKPFNINKDIREYINKEKNFIKTRLKSLKFLKENDINLIVRETSFSKSNIDKFTEFLEKLVLEITDKNLRKKIILNDLYKRIDIYQFAIFVILLNINRIENIDRYVIEKALIFVRFCVIQREKALNEEEVLKEYDIFLEGLK